MLYIEKLGICDKIFQFLCKNVATLCENSPQKIKSNDFFLNQYILIQAQLKHISIE
jgi:hypothetical protein